jgi:hypothetical protein
MIRTALNPAASATTTAAVTEDGETQTTDRHGHVKPVDKTPTPDGYEPWTPA